MGKEKFIKNGKKFGEFKTFGQYILEGRDEKGLSRLSLIELIIDKGQQVDERTVKNWERDAEYPDITMIYILAEILEIHPNDLLEAKQFMFEAGLNSIDMLTMRVIGSIIDTSIWKVHCFLNVFKWAILISAIKIAWKGSAYVPIWFTIVFYIVFIFLSILAARNNFDGV